MHENSIKDSQKGNFFIIVIPDCFLQHIIQYEWNPDVRINDAFWYFMVFDEKGLIFPQSERRWRGSSNERVLYMLT